MIVVSQYSQMAQGQFPLSGFVYAIHPLVNPEHFGYLALGQIKIFAQFSQTW